MPVLSRIRHLVRSSREVTPDVYQLTVKGVNIILFAEKELTLIDTGFPGSATQVAGLLHSLGRSLAEISLIILTHNHLDHAGGLAELKKLTRAKVAAHKADITGNKHRPPNAVEGQKQVPIVFNNALHSVFSVKFSDVDIPLAGGEILAPRGGLEVIHTPGHTPGSISLFSPKDRLLIAGDALRNHSQTLHIPPKMVSHNQTQAVDSIRKMLQSDFAILCCGHGQPLTADPRAQVQHLVSKIK